MPYAKASVRYLDWIYALSAYGAQIIDQLLQGHPMRSSDWCLTKEAVMECGLLTTNGTAPAISSLGTLLLTCTTLTNQDQQR